MLHHVLLQITRSSANMVALVTRKWFFTRVLSHYVLFQFTSCNTHTLCICLAFHQCLFLWMIRWPDCEVLYLHWLHWSSISSMCSLICILRFEALLHEKLHCVHLCGFSPVWITEWAFKLKSNLNGLLHRRQLYVLLDPTLDLLVIEKASTTCECLRTRVTGYLLRHLQLLSPLHSVSLRWLTEIMLRCNTPADHFPFQNFEFLTYWTLELRKSSWICLNR